MTKKNEASPDLQDRIRRAAAVEAAKDTATSEANAALVASLAGEAAASLARVQANATPLTSEAFQALAPSEQLRVLHALVDLGRPAPATLMRRVEHAVEQEKIRRAEGEWLAANLGHGLTATATAAPPSPVHVTLTQEPGNADDVFVTMPRGAVDFFGDVIAGDAERGQFRFTRIDGLPVLYGFLPRARLEGMLATLTDEAQRAIGRGTLHIVDDIREIATVAGLTQRLGFGAPPDSGYGWPSGAIEFIRSCRSRMLMALLRADATIQSGEVLDALARTDAWLATQHTGVPLTFPTMATAELERELMCTWWTKTNAQRASAAATAAAAERAERENNHALQALVARAAAAPNEEKATIASQARALATELIGSNGIDLITWASADAQEARQ